MNPHGPNENVAREPVSEAVQNIADDGSGGRCHHTDEFWQIGQRPFAIRIKQTLCCQLALAFLQQSHQRANACGFDIFDHDLIVGLAGVRRDFAGGDDLEPLLHLCAQLAEIAAPDHRIEFSTFVLDGKIAMAGGVGTPIARQFAAHAHMAECFLKRFLQLVGDLRD